MKWVLDTNVVFSGTITTTGNPHQVLKASLSEGKRHRLLYSELIYEEYERKLKGKAKNYGASKTDIIFFLHMIRRAGKLVEPEEKLQVVEDDPDDDKFFECAAEGGAEYIVSGDPHILNVEEYQTIECIKPKKAVEIIRENL